jgi:CBS domain-containing protein
MVPRARLRSLRESDPLLEAIVRLDSGRVAAFPVVADDDAARLVGLVNRDDVLERLRARQAIVDARVRQAGRPARG